MPFMKKSDLLEAAKTLGVDLEGLSWPEQQSAVQEAMNKAGYTTAPAKYTFPGKSELDEDVLYFESAPKPKPFTPQNNKESFLERYQKAMIASLDKAVPVQICGEIKPMRNALFKYDEDLGEGLEVDDVSYIRNGMPNLDDRDASQTYIVKGRSGRRVVAQSTLPRQNAQIYYDPQNHWLAPIVKDFNGREGYLFKHPKYKGIKALLIESGYWEDYRNLFVATLHPQNIWMAGGKFFACNIQLCEKIVREITKKAKQDAGR